MALPITVGSTPTAFSDGEFTVPAGGTVVLSITASADGGVDSKARYEIARKTAGGKYITCMVLTPVNIVDRGLIVGGNTAATYAARRMANGISSGLESN